MYEGYGLTLFEPRKEGSNLDEIPDEFTVDYFSMQFRQRWREGRLDSDDGKSLFWSIPELDSGDDDYPSYSGYFSFVDKGIWFGLAPYSTILTFVRWFRSIVTAEYPVYFHRLTRDVVLRINIQTTEEEIIEYLEH